MSVHPMPTMPASAAATTIDPAGAGLLAVLTSFADAHGGGEGSFPTPVEGVRVLRAFHEITPTPRVYRPSLCVVIQGAKQITVGAQTLAYGAMECLIVSVELPASGRIVQASSVQPFVGITIDIDITLLRDVIQQMDSVPNLAAPIDSPCVFVAPVDAPLAECIARLLRMSGQPKSIPILYPLVMREICYWLLDGPHGRELCKLALPENQMERVSRSIQMLRENFAQTLRVDQLAAAAGMSASSFHQHFKRLTAMTPVRFQKQLRLTEARRLMLVDAINVAEAAYRVGYESASQFSRDYSRFFGVAPKRSMVNLRKMAA